MAGPKHGESFEEYKKRVIDPISESYCAAKWLNATIWLNNGQTTSCHHPLGHQINAEELVDNPSAIHNTRHKKAMRKLMLEGKRPQECEYCWKIEDLGRNSISDRPYKTAVFDDEDIEATTCMPWDADVMLKTLEISFDRGCNFACSYCNPSFSSSWVKDIHKHGPYHNIDGDARSHYINAADHAIAIPEDKNPYVQAFWRWWDEGLCDSLEEIRVTGGEPLLTEGVWRLFDWFKNNQEKVKARKKPLRFAINSNLGDDALVDRMIELSHYVPWFEVYTSCESVGKHAEYIRDGLKYEKWKRNLIRLHTEGNLVKSHMMMTINSLCLASITEFMDEMLDIKRQYKMYSPIMSLNILRFPSFQNCSMLPAEMRQYYSNKLQSWLDEHVKRDEKIDGGNHPLFMHIEREQTQRLIDYLDVIKTPHKNVKDKDQVLKDCKQFYHQYDVRRGKSFKDTFPEDFVNWLANIPGELPTKEEILTNSYREEMSNITEHPAEDPSADVFVNPDLEDE